MEMTNTEQLASVISKSENLVDGLRDFCVENDIEVGNKSIVTLLDSFNFTQKLLWTKRFTQIRRNGKGN